jgi:biopolymer transport protein ExbB
VLASIGSNAPFLGLLGTVLGIMEAFRRLATIGASDDRAAVVMGSISEALRSTALGILVAIPAVVAYNAFQRRTESALGATESLVRTVLARARASGE